MMAMALIASLNTQIDKLLTSKFLSLTDFGLYSLASTLAQVPSMLTLPITIAILPQLTRLSEEKKLKELTNTYHIYSYIITVIAVILSSIILVYTQDLAYIYGHTIVKLQQV
jgi:O-antigen/teichoic acid export membrane protein